MTRRGPDSGRVDGSGRSGRVDRLAGRAVSSGSVFSTILISSVIEASAPVGSFDLLVDVGSGDSPYRGVIDHRRYVGVDRAPRGADAMLVTGDAERLPVATGSADAVLCTEVIEHVPDEHALASELARIAVGGAPLLLSAPFVHGLHEQPYDFRRLTSIGLVTTLEKAGWTIESFSSIGGSAVVALDGLVRWVDSSWRRLVRNALPRPMQARGLLDGPSARIQHVLASLVLRRSRYVGSSDPLFPAPRLTLGYVVLARRSEVATP